MLHLAAAIGLAAGPSAPRRDSPYGRPGAARPGCLRLDTGNLEGLLPIAAVAQGNDPSIAHREHAVGAVIPTPAEVGVHPWRPHTHN
jgi:hypothetical protein